MRDDIKLTDDEHEALMGAVIAKMHNKEIQVVPVVESIMAARLDAALARNAELEQRLTQIDANGGIADLFAERDHWRKTAESISAKLDSLRDRVNALADKWQDSEFRRKQPVLAYVGLDVAARDLTADRQAFDREVARKGAEVGRMNAAIVRGSDDE